MRIACVACGLLLLLGTGAKADRPVRFRDPGLTGGAPVAAVQAMLDAYSRRSSTYLSWLTPDYRFESEDPEFRAEHPDGLTLDDERAHAQHLFRDESAERDFPRPRATRVEMSIESIVELPGSEDQQSVQILLHLGRLAIPLSDGSTFDIHDTYNVVELVPAEEGWKIRHWHEYLEDPERDLRDLSTRAASDTTKLAGDP